MLLILLQLFQLLVKISQGDELNDICKIAQGDKLNDICKISQGDELNDICYEFLNKSLDLKL